MANKTNNPTLFDFLEEIQEDVKKNINIGNIDFVDKTFDNIIIPEVFAPISTKIKVIKDLKYYKIEEVKKQLKSLNQDLFESYINTIMNGWDYYLLHLESRIKNLTYYSILIDRVNGKKLEDIGKSKGLSRERIRQIEKRTIEEVLVYASTYIDVKFQNNIYSDVFFYNFYDIFSFIPSKEVINVIVYSIMSKEKLTYGIYSKEFDSYINPNKVQSISIIKKLISVDNYFNYYDAYSKVNNILIFTYNILDFTFNIYQNYLRYKNYIFKGNLAMIPGTCTTNSLISLVIKENYPKGCMLDEEGIKSLDKLIQNKFQHSFKVESAISKIDELNPELIVWDKLKRIHIKNVRISSEKLTQILNSFREIMKSSTYQLLENVYNLMTEVLEKTEITDKYKLYGVLKYYLKEEYYFKKMGVRSKKLKDLTLKELVYEYIDKNDKCTFEDIIKAVDIPIASLQSIVRDDERIVQGENYLSLVSKLKLTDEEINNIRKYINNEMTKGFIHRDVLYNKYASELKQMKIVDSLTMYSICKFLFSKEFNFYIPYIQELSIDSPITIKKLIIDQMKLSGVINIKKLEDTLASITNTNDFSLLYNIRLSDIKAFRIDLNYLTLSSNIRIDEITRYMLINRLIDHFKNNKYAVESDIEQLSKGLSYHIISENKKYYMNVHSFSSYTDEFVSEYHVINSLGINNYSNLKYAIVKENISYTDMIYCILKESSENSVITKKQAMKILKDKKILNCKSFIFTSNKYCEVTEENIIFK